MSKIEVVEVCPQCGEENVMQWDFERFGLNAFCPVCGTQMLLCDECMHRDEFESSCASCPHTKDCTERKYSYVTDGGPAYDVEITEVLKKTVSINAVTAKQAEIDVVRRYREGDFIIDAENIDIKTSVVAVKKLDIPAE